MELYFNELSRSAKLKWNDEYIYEIIEIIKTLKKYDIKTCRIANEDLSYLYENSSTMSKANSITSFLFSFFRAPFENNDIMQYEDIFFAHDWKYSDQECLGLVFAYLFNSASLSLNQESWACPNISILCDSEKISVRNISNSNHIAVHNDYFEKQIQINLLECDLPFEDKKIKLSEDHGKDILMDFSKKIVKNVYVCEVLGSLPYSNHKRKFIRNVCSDGCIDICLPWTDQGLGIRIKTTGRNMRETRMISQIIEEKYGYKA